MTPDEILQGLYDETLVGNAPRVLELTEEGRAAVGLGPDERFVALIHLGHPVQERTAPEREPAENVTQYLD